jgi:integrase
MAIAVSENLTNTDLITYLLSSSEEDTEMKKGTIRTKQTCPVCDKKFVHIPKLGFICPEHKTQPTRFFVDLNYHGKRLKIYSHKSGRVLDSYGVAQETLNHIRHEIRNHTFDPSKYMKADLEKFYFKNVAQSWIDEKLKDVEQGMMAYSYVKELIAYNNKYFTPFFGTKDIREIRRYDIDEFKASLPEHLLPKTIKNIFVSLKNFFNTALKKESIERVPSFPTIQVPEYAEWKWIDAEMQIKILDALPESDRPIFAFLFLHGCRPGEARALKIKDIDLKSKTLRIRRTFSLNQLRETTKQKRQNIIPIHAEFLPYIEEEVKTSFPDSFLFMNRRTGSFYNDETLRKIWHKALKKTGLEHSGLRLYDASRHSFASQLVNANVPFNIISKLLGHSSLKMTQRYAHESIDTMNLAIQKLTLSSVPKVSPAIKKA